ncbi:MAG TPA: hypothetical protein EYG03_14270 [Planctomycetes bacterium]|nr:hypothetical protein [Planctomycetota bacterium]
MEHSGNGCSLKSRVQRVGYCLPLAWDVANRGLVGSQATGSQAIQSRQFLGSIDIPDANVLGRVC